MLGNRRFWDLLTAALLAAVLLVFSAVTLDAGQPLNSDDYAGYLLQGIAISEGTLDEQIRLNPLMHPSPAPFLKAEDETLTYVWGYPLVLAALHRAVGFDTETYASLLYYKLPAALAYAAIGAVLFLFYRRRFSWGASLFLSLCFCLNPLFAPDVNIISPDIPFLLFFLLCILLLEIALDDGRPLRRMLCFGALGFCLWYTYVLRLNGFSILLITGIAHAVWLFENRRQLSMRSLWHLTPYALCFLLLGLSYLFFPVPTSNLSDIGDVDFATILGHIPYYFDLFCRWFSSLFAMEADGLFYAAIVGPAMLVLFVIGVLRSRFWQHAHFHVLIACTLGALILLPYRQGLRYTYTILPFLLLFAAHGAACVRDWLRSHMDDVLQKASCIAVRCTGILVAAVLVGQTGLAALDQFRHRGEALEGENMYSTYAVETYRHIQQNTPEDCTIAYFKPRALYLNTGRLSFKPQLPDELIHNGEVFLPYQNHRTELTDADYLLLCSEVDDTNPLYPPGEQLRRLTAFLDGKARLERVYHNPSYELFQILPIE